MSNEFIAELRKWAAEVVRSNASGEVAGMHRAVELISKHFLVQPHEVAILVAMPDDRFLRHGSDSADECQFTGCSHRSRKTP